MYTKYMRCEDLLAFARRDRQAVEVLRVAHWTELASVNGPAALFAVADSLRREVRLHAPDWPTATERAADLECHMRVAEALRSVRVEPRH
jgi:hypothetical protein